MYIDVTQLALDKSPVSECYRTSAAETAFLLLGVFGVFTEIRSAFPNRGIFRCLCPQHGRRRVPIKERVAGLLLRLVGDDLRCFYGR